jgi:glycine cleavage system H lipoate-binding protein/TusA-related sulfurtransferase
LKIDQCDFPDDLLYDVERNVWIRMADGRARVGVNSILVWLSGRLSSVTLKPVGTRVSTGQPIGSIEGPRHFDVVRAPLSGAITRMNGALLKEPGAVSKDPYGAGWMAEMTPSLRGEVTRLARLPAGKEALSAKVKQLRVHCFAEFPDYEMFEIGVECSAVLVKLNELLRESRAGTVVHVVSDDQSADIEMIRWSEQTSHPLLESRKEGNLHHFIVRKNLSESDADSISRRGI